MPTNVTFLFALVLIKCIKLKCERNKSYMYPYKESMKDQPRF